MSLRHQPDPLHTPATEQAFLQTHQKLVAARQRVKTLEVQVEAGRIRVASLDQRIAQLEAELEATRTQLEISEARTADLISDAFVLRDHLNRHCSPGTNTDATTTEEPTHV